MDYSALENPIGIETAPGIAIWAGSTDYSALENPIGIETPGRAPCRPEPRDYSALENPIGIETSPAPGTRRGWAPLQRIRKPNRD